MLRSPSLTRYLTVLGGPLRSSTSRRVIQAGPIAWGPLVFAWQATRGIDRKNHYGAIFLGYSFTIPRSGALHIPRLVFGRVEIYFVGETRTTRI